MAYYLYMPKQRHIDISQLQGDREVAYAPGELLLLGFRRRIAGFGVHFAPIVPHSAWKLRVENSGVGLQTYAQSQRFSLDDVELCLESAGDETLEVLPDRAGLVLAIHAEHKGVLRRAPMWSPPYEPPNWAYDFWFSTPMARMSEGQVWAEVQTAHRMRLHPTVWLLDADWASTEHWLRVDPYKFPSGDGFLSALGDLDIKPVVWLAPWVQTGTVNWDFFNKQRWFAEDESGKSRIFPVTGNGQVKGSYLDFTNQAFVDYFTQAIGAALDRGVAGFMFDFGESLPDGAMMAGTTESSRTALAAGIVGHNWYVGEVKRVMREAVEGRDVALISRSGWTQSYASTGLWLGDQSSDSSRFAGLGSVAWGYRSAYQAGYRFVGMDIGGYFGFPNVADYMRWLDLAVAMPFSMHHGMLHANPWEIGPDALAHHRYARKLHTALWGQGKRQVPKFELDRSYAQMRAIQAGDYRFSL